MDVGSKNGYPAGALSNFSPHPFIIDGVQCNSMEGFLQGLKFESKEMQEYVCSLVGYAANIRISNSHVISSSIEGKDYAGGICGYNEYGGSVSNSMTINNTNNENNVNENFGISAKNADFNNNLEEEYPRTLAQPQSQIIRK